MSDYFNKGRSGSGRPSFGPKRFGGGNKRSFGDRSFAPKAQYEAECASCHKMCDVPFQPNGKKPVFCKDCFQGQERSSGRSSDRGFERGSGSRYDSAPRREAPARAAAPAPDKRIDDLMRSVEQMGTRIEKLADHIEKMSKSLELGTEVRRLSAAQSEPKAAPAKRAVKKVTAKKTVAKPPAKAPAKAPKKAAKK